MKRLIASNTADVDISSDSISMILMYDSHWRARVISDMEFQNNIGISFWNDEYDENDIKKVYDLYQKYMVYVKSLQEVVKSYEHSYHRRESAIDSIVYHSPRGISSAIHGPRFLPDKPLMYYAYRSLDNTVAICIHGSGSSNDHRILINKETEVSLLVAENSGYMYPIREVTSRHFMVFDEAEKIIGESNEYMPI